MRARDLFQATIISTAVAGGLIALILLFSDCDLFLWAAEHFGSSPASLSGQVVWVTGASSGIGEELVYILAAAGCRLVLSARREQELNRVKQNCVDKYGRKSEDILVLPLDVQKFDTHQAAVEKVVKYFKQVDILVNNAGRSQRVLIAETSLDVDRQALEVNTLGPISLTKAVLPYMVSRKSGLVVAVSSVVGKMGAPGLGSYAASKHALHGWFDTLRMESYEHNIRVSMVLPGPIFSDALKHAFTGKAGQELGIDMSPGEHRMATNRCSQLIAIAMANQLDEAWISMQPELSYLYLNQYLPAIARWAAVRIGARRLEKIKRGEKDLYD